jgi:ABC-type amino acid transport substrate-binding protein
VAQATIDKLNATLQAMSADGTIETINKKYQ